MIGGYIGHDIGGAPRSTDGVAAFSIVATASAEWLARADAAASFATASSTTFVGQAAANVASTFAASGSAANALNSSVGTAEPRETAITGQASVEFLSGSSSFVGAQFSTYATAHTTFLSASKFNRSALVVTEPRATGQTVLSTRSQGGSVTKSMAAVSLVTSGRASTVSTSARSLASRITSSRLV